MVSSRDMVVLSLRKAADVLANSEGTLRLPGWDNDSEATALRAVARAIAEDGPAEGTQVSLSSVGGLVQYLADMLEE